jgi:hypothetical protein
MCFAQTSRDALADDFWSRIPQTRDQDSPALNGDSATPYMNRMGLPGTWWWEEYPFAMAMEGGAGATVAPALKAEQLIPGGVMGTSGSWAIGTEFRVRWTP